MKTRLITFFLLVILLLSTISSAHATCTLRGFAARVATFNGKTFMYFRTNHTSNYYYLGVTTDPFVSDAMYQGFRGKTKLLVQSTADDCPPVTGAGEHKIGVITIVGLGY